MVSPVARPRAYLVSYRLKLAQLRYGRVAGAFFAPCTRRFATDELTVILADIYAEVGPAANLLGIEILAIRPIAALACSSPSFYETVV
ncbi:MAG: hypothetical protein EOO59_01510 [Hymenobacter sp.]|nr:MAG: hypothetical protein EOO59_01510 [Hymenobacter sp.]